MKDRREEKSQISRPSIRPLHLHQVYQAKEAAEKAARRRSRRKGSRTAEIEKEIRERLWAHGGRDRLGECDSKIGGERREDDAYLGPIRDMRRS